MSLRNRVRAAVARHRLRDHMYGRLIGGGTPDCPCSRCEGDRVLLMRLGTPWSDPERDAYYRDLERVIQQAKRPELTARCYPDCEPGRCAVADSCVYRGNETPWF